MIKNAIIGFLLVGLLFTNTFYGQYGTLAYIAMSMLVFAGICYLEYQTEQYVAKVKRLKKFKRTVNRKIALNTPTKAS